MKIDSHQHFLHYTAEKYAWIDDSMSVLKKDHLPEHLHKVQRANGINGSIAVQARQTIEETAWLLAMASENPFIRGVVGWVDLRGDSLDEQLAQFSQHPKFVGVRHVVQDEPDDRFLLSKTFMRGIAKLHQYNLAYDILIFPKQLPAAVEFVKAFPEQRFVLDHIAKPFIKNGILSPWDDQINKLAEHSNVDCKISGLVTEADWFGWSIHDFDPYLDVIVDAFGMQRLMFGSDWPVCTVAASYEKVIEIVAAFLNKRTISSEDKAAFWGGNAKRFYQLTD